MDKMWWGIRVATWLGDDHEGSLLVAIVRADSEANALERFRELKLEWPSTGDYRPPQLLDTEKKLDDAQKELKENITFLYERTGYWAKLWNAIRSNRDAFKRGG